MYLHVVAIWAVPPCSLAGLQSCHILKMSVGGVFETCVTIYQTTRRHIPQLRSVGIHSCRDVTCQYPVGKFNAIEHRTELEVDGGGG